MAIPRSNLITLFSDLSEIPCIWVGDPEPIILPTLQQPGVNVPTRAGMFGALKTSALQSVGVDDRRRKMLSRTNALKTTSVGWRVCTLSFEIKDFSGNGWAQDVMDSLRSRLALQSSIDTLRATGIVLGQFSPTQEIQFAMDERAGMKVVLDVRASYVTTIEDAQLDGGWIQTVDGNDEVPGTLTS